MENTEAILSNKTNHFTAQCLSFLTYCTIHNKGGGDGDFLYQRVPNVSQNVLVLWTHSLRVDCFPSEFFGLLFSKV